MKELKKQRNLTKLFSKNQEKQSKRILGNGVNDVTNKQGR